VVCLFSCLLACFCFLVLRTHRPAPAGTPRHTHVTSRGATTAFIQAWAALCKHAAAALLSLSAATLQLAYLAHRRAAAMPLIARPPWLMIGPPQGENAKERSRREPDQSLVYGAVPDRSPWTCLLGLEGRTHTQDRHYRSLFGP